MQQVFKHILEQNKPINTFKGITEEIPTITQEPLLKVMSVIQAIL